MSSVNIWSAFLPSIIHIHSLFRGHPVSLLAVDTVNHDGTWSGWKILWLFPIRLSCA